MLPRDTGVKVNLLDPRLKARKKGAQGLQGTYSEWDRESRGKGLTAEGQAYIDSLPRVETKSAQNQELLAELKERNDGTAQQYAMPDQALMRRNQKQREGKIMHFMRLLKKLRAAGIKCGYNAEPFEGQVGLKCVRPGHEQLGYQYICAVKMGWTTEYDFFHYDAHGVELNKKFIGWRTVLVMLIARGILTESQAHAIFGRPQICDASVIYRRNLFSIRNRCGLIQA